MLKSFRLLADPTRVRLLLLLERQELSVAEIQEILGMGQSRISTHLAQLKRAGFLSDRRAGKHIYYGPPRPDGGEVEPFREMIRQSAGEIPESDSDQAALGVVLRKRQDRARSYFDQLAGKFGRTYCPGRSWEAVAQMLFTLVPPVVVADFGAGEGMLAQLLAKQARRVIAIDNSENMVAYGSDLAQRHGLDNLEYRLGDIEDPPVADGEVDVALFSQALHHAANPARALAGAFRCLRPGGRILILDLAAHHFEEARELYADLWLGFSEAELHGMLVEAGFDAVRTSLLPREAEAPHFQALLAVADKRA